MQTRFSNYAVLTPAEHRFHKAPELYWRIRPATSRDELTMNIFINTPTIHPGETSERYPTGTEISWREIALLFVGSNIPTSEIPAEEFEKCKSQSEVDALYAKLPRLDDKATVDQIERLLADMPVDMVKELWTALGAVTPGWGPRKEKKVV